MYYFTSSDRSVWSRLNAKTLRSAKREAAYYVGYTDVTIRIVETDETDMFKARLNELTPVVKRVNGNWM